jgi:hypothetical protein
VGEETGGGGSVVCGLKLFDIGAGLTAGKFGAPLGKAPVPPTGEPDVGTVV